MREFGKAFLGSVPLAVAQTVSGQRWWIHHISNTRAYLEAAFAGDTDRSVAAILELWNGILEWQGIAGKAAGVLMAEHTALAKLLVDCLALGQGAGCADAAAAALGRNVEAQKLLFPKSPVIFADLFGKHVEITGAYVVSYSEGNTAAFEERYRQAIENGRELGLFTDLNFSR